jgi:hypothetical protein
MANYYEQVAAMRRSKQQEEIALERNQAIRGYELSLQNRQEIEREAATTNDPDEQQRLRDMWHYYDAELQRCEADIRRFTPPAPPDPRAVEYMRRPAGHPSLRSCPSASSEHRELENRLAEILQSPRHAPRNVRARPRHQIRPQ